MSESLGIKNRRCVRNCPKVGFCHGQSPNLQADILERTSDTPIVFSGGPFTVTESDAKQFADNLLRTLDRVRERLCDMILVDGGESKGGERLAASWAKRHKISQVVFNHDPKLGRHETSCQDVG